jgi:hypothetical protein
MFRLVLLVLYFFASYSSADGGTGWDPLGSSPTGDLTANLDPNG